MKLSIVTTVTDPDRREDRWREALGNYCALADEVVVVNGGEPLDPTPWPKAVQIMLPWPDQWHWMEITRHRNAGAEAATGDWIIGLDIDQMIHERDFRFLREKLERAHKSGCAIATLMKHSTLYHRKWFEKGPQPIAFRNGIGLRYGRDSSNQKDCEGNFVVEPEKTEDFGGYIRPVGSRKNLKCFKTGIAYWNYDYFFKTKEASMRELVRYERAKIFGFGRGVDHEGIALDQFLTMQQWRYENRGRRWRIEDHPACIRSAVEGVKPEQFGYNAWGMTRI